jgi:hypothetical protein
MGKMNLSLIATIVPLIIVGIGLIGWVLSLRSDVTTTVGQINGIQEELSGVHKTIDVEVERLHTVWDSRFREMQDKVDTQQEYIADLEKSLAVADDQMQTIMGDHMGFNDVLQELGKSGVLPSGERRSYGGYGN